MLFGDESPSGRLPHTIPARLEDTPAYLSYPGENGHVPYSEGIFVGYRWYDARRIEPRLPFGHGLSYTTFEYGPLDLERAEVGPGEELRARIRVRNTGQRRGAEVVQLYVRDVAARLARPEKELAAFAKLALEPGEERDVELTVAPRSLAYWDPAKPGWIAEPGEFELLAGASSRDLRSRATLRLRA